jgi:hypothetical protein
MGKEKERLESSGAKVGIEKKEERFGEDNMHLKNGDDLLDRVSLASRLSLSCDAGCGLRKGRSRRMRWRDGLGH